MRQSRLASLFALALAAGCAHRFPVPPGGEREVVAGLPASFGSAAQNVPEGTRIKWDFGDGTASAAGATVEHVFARAGERLVKMEVTDGAGVRQAVFRVKVQRRPPAAAVPPNARWAVILDRFFARVPQFAALGERVGGSDRAVEALGGIQQVLGFDPTRPAAVLEAGIDPEVGLAVASLPDDAGTWLALGVVDGKEALERLRRAMVAHGGVEISEGPQGGLRAVSDSEETLALPYRGFLYIHVGKPGEKASWSAILQAPPEGLWADPGFASARASVEGDDAFFFARAAALPVEGREKLPAEASALLSHAVSLALGATLKESEADVAGLLSLDPEGSAQLAQWSGPPKVSALPSTAPAGAVAYGSLFLTPALVRTQLENLLPLTGLAGTHRRALKGLSALVSGEVGLALYFDVVGLFRNLAASTSPMPKFFFVASLGVTDRLAAVAALKDVAGEAKAMKGRRDAFVASFEGHPAGAALVGDAVHVGFGDVFLQDLSDDRTLRRLSDALQATLTPASLLPGHHVVFLDVAGALDALRNPPPIAGVEAGKQRVLAAMAGVLLDQAPELRPVLQLRDLLLDAWQAQGGLSARLRVRFR